MALEGFRVGGVLQLGPANDLGGKGNCDMRASKQEPKCANHTTVRARACVRPFKHSRLHPHWRWKWGKGASQPSLSMYPLKCVRTSVRTKGTDAKNPKPPALLLFATTVPCCPDGGQAAFRQQRRDLPCAASDKGYFAAIHNLQQPRPQTDQESSDCLCARTNAPTSAGHRIPRSERARPRWNMLELSWVLLVREQWSMSPTRIKPVLLEARQVPG